MQYIAKIQMASFMPRSVSKPTTTRGAFLFGDCVPIFAVPGRESNYKRTQCLGALSKAHPIKRGLQTMPLSL